jgi:hypothetical protein
MLAYAFSEKHTIRMQSYDRIVCPSGVSGHSMTFLTGNDGVEYSARDYVMLLEFCIDFFCDIAAWFRQVSKLCYPK